MTTHEVEEMLDITKKTLIYYAKFMKNVATRSLNLT